MRPLAPLLRRRHCGHLVYFDGRCTSNKKDVMSNKCKSERISALYEDGRCTSKRKKDTSRTDAKGSQYQPYMKTVDAPAKERKTPVERMQKRTNINLI
jgi:hypothetical protein